MTWVWLIRLDADARAAASLTATLSDDERLRSARFRFERDRLAFVVARGALRTILGHYLGRVPEAVTFAYGSAGKPRLADAALPHFNLSHSGGLCAIALAHCELGIDVEAVRTIETQAIANRFFSSHERDALAALPESERTLAFFRGWTRKEAYLKATGDGLSTPLECVRVTLGPDEPARILAIADRAPGEASAWTIQDLALGPEYAGALAYRHAPFETRVVEVGNIRSLSRQLVARAIALP